MVGLLGGTRMRLQIFFICANNFFWTETLPKLDTRIVGGQATTIEENPYQLALFYRGYHQGAAVILKPDVAVTVAHCVYGLLPSNFLVRGGSSKTNVGGQVLNVENIAWHPKYNATTFDYDIAILAFAGQLVFGPAVQPVPLQQVGREVRLGTFCTVTGWGALSYYGFYPDVLQTLQVPKVSDGYCRYVYGSKQVTARMTCYGYQEANKDACQNDSGGPLVCNGTLVGLVSYGESCGLPGYPGVYTNVNDVEIHRYIMSAL